MDQVTEFVVTEDMSWKEFIRQLREDLKKAALELKDQEARYLVDDYYILQEVRKRFHNQASALEKGKEPAAAIIWLQEFAERTESWIQNALGLYVKGHPMGDWIMGVRGIGPVLAAGILAYIDINKAPTVGHIWQFCGIAGSGQRPWLPKTKRPWSAGAKTLCWKIGESFVKFSNNPECYYGGHFRARKALEITRNDAGMFVDQAMHEAPHKGKTTSAWPWNAACYEAGTCAKIMEIPTDKRDDFLKRIRREPGEGQPMLHPGHINDRAKRYAVKLFLAHLHGEWFERTFGEPPPKPYPIQFLGHTGYIPAPAG